MSAHPSSTSRILAAGVALAATFLFAPTQAKAQSIAAYQAMGNVSSFASQGPGTVDVTPGGTIDGAGALLGGSPAGIPGESAEAVRVVDGAQALLGRARVTGLASR
jgi:hypothetical protein